MHIRLKLLPFNHEDQHSTITDRTASYFLLLTAFLINAFIYWFFLSNIKSLSQLKTRKYLKILKLFFQLLFFYFSAHTFPSPRHYLAHQLEAIKYFDREKSEQIRRSSPIKACIHEASSWNHFKFTELITFKYSFQILILKNNYWQQFAWSVWEQYHFKKRQRRAAILIKYIFMLVYNYLLLFD